MLSEKNIAAKLSKFLLGSKSRNRRSKVSAVRGNRFRRTLAGSVESLESRQLLAADVLFADSFEAGQWTGNWVEDSQNDWFTSSQRSTDGAFSAEVDGRANDATLQLGSPIDLSGYAAARLNFDWLIEDGFDSGEYLAADVSSDGGASWVTVAQLNGNAAPESQWVSETVDLTPYATSNVLIQFRANISHHSEDANVDNVRITGTAAATIDPAKPVKVFVLAGQSNMNGTALAENLDPAWNVHQEDVVIWLDHKMDGGEWTTLEPGHGLSTHAPRPDEPEGLDDRNGLGPELSIGRILADTYPDYQIALIKHSNGGRDLASDFNPENIGPPDSIDHMWSGLLKKSDDAFASLDAAGATYEVGGFFWALGGRDARNWNYESSDPAEVEAGEQEALERSAAYGDNLTNFISAVRDRYATDLPFIMSRMADYIDPALLEKYPGAELVRQGQLDVAASDTGTVAFTTDGLTKRDEVHFDAMGQIEYGTRFANGYLGLVSNTNQRPLVNAGVDQTLSDGDGSGVEIAMFSGSANDSDGSIVSYEWSDGTNVLGTDPTLAISLPIGVYTLTLSATDNEGAVGTDTVTVTVLANQGPTADAGADQTVTDSDSTGSEVVTLNGIGTDSDGSIVAYEWKQQSTFIGNTASISPDLSVGTHTLTLTVTDNGGATASDEITVTVEAPAQNDPNALYVYDITFESRKRGRDHRAVFEIRSDEDASGTAGDNPVAGVAIEVTFAGITYTGTTDSNGRFRTGWLRLSSGNDYYANAVDLALSGYTWNPFDVAEEEDDSDGDGLPDELLSL